MGFYLLDNPPASPQFHTSRANTPTWAVGVHTSEGPRDAEALCRFIAGRSDPGSYSTVVDADSTIDLVPHDYTTFSIATSGYNSRTYSVCIAGRSADLSAGDSYTLACIDRLGAVIVNLWTLVGVNPVGSANWIGTEALNRPGLFCHGDVQPWDRTDAWSTHPERAALDQALIDSIVRHAHLPPSPEEDDVKSVILVDPRDGKAWHASGNTRVYLSHPDQMQALAFLGAQTINPAPVAWIDALAILPRNGGINTPGK